jgi:hypothetical protein
MYPVSRYAVVLFLCLEVLLRAQGVPPTQAKTLNGSTVSFPIGGSRKPLLLLAGFRMNRVGSAIGGTNGSNPLT